MQVTKSEILPNGVLYNEDVLREIELVRFDGSHEDLIHDKKNLREGNAIEKLVKSCIARIGDEKDPDVIGKIYDKHLIMPDLTFVLVKLRMYGIGKFYEFTARCPNCEKDDKYNIDLETLKMDEQKEEHRKLSEFRALIEPEDETPFFITFRHLYVGDSKMLSLIKKDHGSDKATRELALQLKTINDRPINGDFKNIKKLSWKSRNAIRSAMDETVGGLNTEIIMECKSCDDREFVATMPIELRSFFYPKGPKNSTPRLAKPFLGYGGPKLSSETDTDGNQAR